MIVEDDVVGAAQHATVVARSVENLHHAGIEVDPLDPAARIIGSDAVRREHPVALDIVEAAVVAAIQLAVGSDREAVGTAAGRGEDILAAVGADAGDPPGLDLDQDDAAVGQPHRSFREAQPVGDELEIGHVSLHPR